MERVHKICSYLKFAPDECNRCKKWERDPVHGKVKRGCRAMAEEVLSIARTGDPFAYVRKEFKASK